MSETVAAAGRLQGRVVLITGASRGLGAAVAEGLAGEGAHLVLVARTVGGLEAADDRVRARGGEATLVPLDLTAPDGIEHLGAALAERFGRLDGLVACAGRLGVLSPVAHTEPSHVEALVRLHLLANHRLIRSLDPLLRAAEAGRAVFVTESGSQRRAYAGAYGASAAALRTLALTWADELRKTAVRVAIVDPGPMRTRFRAQAHPGEERAALIEPEVLAGHFVELLTPGSGRQGEVIRLQTGHD